MVLLTMHHGSQYVLIDYDLTEVHVGGVVTKLPILLTMTHCQEIRNVNLRKSYRSVSCL